jgi:hypothetical protein
MRKRHASKTLSIQQIRVPHTPGFPVKGSWGNELHAAFLNESRTRGTGWRCVQEIRVSHTLFVGDVGKPLRLIQKFQPSRSNH